MEVGSGASDPSREEARTLRVGPGFKRRQARAEKDGSVAADQAVLDLVPVEHVEVGAARPEW
jgi:hypothetical protein